MCSWLSRTARYRCVWERYWPSSAPKTALCALCRLERVRSVTSRRSRETHRHDYTRLPAALSDGPGGLSTSLGLYASPPLILSTESVVVMEWKGMSTAASTASNRKGPLGLQSTCSCPSTPSRRLSRSKVSVMDLHRAPARCSISPPHCPCTLFSLNSCAQASHGFFVTSPWVRGTRSSRQRAHTAVFGVEDGL